MCSREMERTLADRCDTAGNPEAQYQPGSNNLVLLNKLGITDAEEMDEIEVNLLEQLTESVLNEVTEDQVITTQDLSEWHRRWLGNVYEWAGKYRSVNMGKGDFQFAAAHLIPKLMTKFEDKYLATFTPCNRMNEGELITALATVHVEFVLVHPFREGNGRLSRLLANVMALQAGQPVLDFTHLDEHKSEYFAAIQAGLDDYEPMKEMFRQVLHASQQNAGE